MEPAIAKDGVIAATRRWISAFVIGLNLCPFAQRVFDGDRIRYVVTDADNEGALRADLRAELLSLADSDTIETTLLIHPGVLGDFLDYNDFLDAADALLAELDLEGVIQIASFHPKYQFADADQQAVENFTNRSPYPMLHLLREESITAVADDPEKLLEIPQRNVETLRAVGRDKIAAMLAAVRSG